jgi:hypothetical protein
MSIEPSSPSRFRRDPESSSRWLPTHQKRAGLGVWTAGRSCQARTAIKLWKRNHPFDPGVLAGFSAAVVELPVAGGQETLLSALISVEGTGGGLSSPAW